MEIDKLISYINMSKKTVFFGGAGVSTASGLQDFRGSNGLYKEKRKYPPEEILSHTFFMKHTDLFYEFYKEKLNSLPKCSCGGIIKPDVVLYEEALDNKVLTEAIKEVSEADLLIVGGTSLQVYPASSLVTYFRGKHLVLINKDETPYDYLADIVIHDDLASVFEKINKSISLN